MIILLGGAPASGKSTMSVKLAKQTNSVIVPQDSFYDCEFTFSPFNTKGELEQPDIVDWKRLIAVVSKVSNEVNVIVEGHCIYSNRELVSIADKCYFINIEYEQCREKYIKRYETYDSEELKGDYFDNYVWPIHKKYQEDYILGNDKIVHIKWLPN